MDVSECKFVRRSQTLPAVNTSAGGGGGMELPPSSDSHVVVSALLVLTMTSYTNLDKGCWAEETESEQYVCRERPCVVCPVKGL